MDPLAISITWGAGGSTKERTLELAGVTQEQNGLDTVMHLTCTNMKVGMVDEALAVSVPSSPTLFPVALDMHTEYAQGSQRTRHREHPRAARRYVPDDWFGRTIASSRADPPRGQEEWTPIDPRFQHGIDLVKYIRQEHGDYFDIAVAGFPQTIHLPEAEAKQEMQWLKEKCDAGANFIFTQMFYDADMFIQWVKAARQAGITIPIVPGIAPIQTWNGFMRATSLAKTHIPKHFLDALEPHKNDDEKVRAIGTKLVAELCE